MASVVKAEIKEEPFDQEDLNETELDSDNEEEECYRIIEETVVDVSTLPGKKKSFAYYPEMFIFLLRLIALPLF